MLPQVGAFHMDLDFQLYLEASGPLAVVASVETGDITGTFVGKAGTASVEGEVSGEAPDSCRGV
jgi:hypothetical protein